MMQMAKTKGNVDAGPGVNNGKDVDCEKADEWNVLQDAHHRGRLILPFQDSGPACQAAYHQACDDPSS